MSSFSLWNSANPLWLRGYLSFWKIEDLDFFCEERENCENRRFEDICVEDCEVEDVTVTKSEMLAPRVDGYGASIISD